MNNNLTDAQHAANKAKWASEVDTTFEAFITRGHLTRGKFDLLTNKILAVGLAGKTYENSVTSNVSEEQLAQSIIQMYQEQIEKAGEDVNRQASRLLEGLISSLSRQSRLQQHCRQDNTTRKKRIN
jgi:hypothetical protein